MNFKRYHESKNLWSNNSAWSNGSTDTRSYFRFSIRYYSGSAIAGEQFFKIESDGFSYFSITPQQNTTQIQIKHDGSTRDLLIGSVYGNFTAGVPITVSFDVNGYDPTTVGGISISNIMFNTGSQPFPYEPYSSEVWHDIPYYTHKTATDTLTLPATLYPNDTSITVGLKGNEEHTGTPSPQNPVMPNGTGERTGNLLDYTTVESTSNATATQISGGISVSGRYYVRFRTVQFSVGNEYTMSWKANTTSGTSAPAWRFRYADNTYSSMPSSGGALIAEKEVTELLLYVSTSANCVVEFTELMLNTGSTALPYEPYGYKIPISSDGENLLNADTTISGIINNNGEVEPNFAYGTSDYIPMTGTFTLSLISQYTASNRTIIFAAYDSTKEFISTFGDAGAFRDGEIVRTRTAPPETAYIRICYIIRQGMADEYVMLNRGSTALPYSPYNRTTTPIYLGEVPTTRKIKKLVLTGQERWIKYAAAADSYLYYLTGLSTADVSDCICTHTPYSSTIPNGSDAGVRISDSQTVLLLNCGSTTIQNNTKEDFKAWLAAQYSAGHPVTVWYVLATPTTGIVNEPLRKIGDYADEVSGISIPTIAGANTLSVDTTLQPSEVTVNYKGWHPVADVHERENGAWT